MFKKTKTIEKCKQFQICLVLTGKIYQDFDSNLNMQNMKCLFGYQLIVLVFGNLLEINNQNERI